MPRRSTLLWPIIAVLTMAAVPASRQPAPSASASQILQATIDALARVESAQYDVRLLDGYNAGGAKQPGHSHIVIARSPFQYRAAMATDDGLRRELAVFDGTTSRFSTGGAVIDDGPPRAMINQASADVLNTRSAFDREYLAAARSSGRIVYAGQDDVDGETCRVVEYVTLGTGEVGSDTHVYWLSVKTGLPRAVQTWRIVRGKALLTERFVISNVELNPAIPAETFRYVPTAADSTRARSGAVEPAAPASASRFATGIALPDLELRDRDNKTVSIATLKGTATVISFWAPWCSPCLAELPVLQKLAAGYGGKLQVAAIAVKDSRLSIVQFIDAHTGYGFRFFVDPDLGQSKTRLESFFEIVGIPVNVFVDAAGRVLDRWEGFDGEIDLARRLDGLMKKSASVRSARL